jgi:hypothetical protein
MAGQCSNIKPLSGEALIREPLLSRETGDALIKALVKPPKAKPPQADDICPACGTDLKAKSKRALYQKEYMRKRRAQA